MQRSPKPKTRIEVDRIGSLVSVRVFRNGKCQENFAPETEQQIWLGRVMWPRSIVRFVKKKLKEHQTEVDMRRRNGENPHLTVASEKSKKNPGLMDWKEAEKIAKGFDDKNIRLAAQQRDIDEVQRLIAEECDELKSLLLAKNKAYGNSALDPLRIFAAGLDADAQIRVRIDDKLSRIKRGSADAKKNVPEDTERDLSGYFVLLRVNRKWQKIKALRRT